MDRRERVADTDDEWQAHVTRQAAKAIGEWLEARGKLHQPIRVLALWELEAMAQAAISSFVVLGCSRIKDEPGQHPDLTRFLLARPCARCAGGKPKASATSTACAMTNTRSTASALVPASRPAPRSPDGAKA